MKSEIIIPDTNEYLLEFSKYHNIPINEAIEYHRTIARFNSFNINNNLSLERRLI